MGGAWLKEQIYRFTPTQSFKSYKLIGMEVTVFIDKKIEPDQIVKKVMAEKNAFKEAITNGTVRAFAKKHPGKRKALSANG